MGMGVDQSWQNHTSLTRDDIGAVAKLANDKVIHDMTEAVPYPYGEEQARAWIEGQERYMAEGRGYPMAVTLNREGDVESVAEYVASLAPVFPASTLSGNSGRGADSYVVCVTCHGEDGLGNQDLHAPPIVQMHDWYLLNQLRNYKSGARGAHPDDVWGGTMRVNTLVLDDQAMQDVIAYVQTLR